MRGRKPFIRLNRHDERLTQVSIDPFAQGFLIMSMSVITGAGKGPKAKAVEKIISMVDNPTIIR